MDFETDKNRTSCRSESSKYKLGQVDRLVMRAQRQYSECCE